MDLLAYALAVVVISIFACRFWLKKPGIALKNGDVALVTGGGSGIGRQLACDLASIGCDIVLVDINSEALDESKRLVEEQAGHGAPIKVWCVQCDVSSHPAVQSAVGRVRSAVGKPITALINNAGIVSGKRLLDSEPDAMFRTLAVNSMAPMWLAQAFLPDMLQAGRGVIVGMASTMGLVSAAHLTDYCASKWAHVGFMEALRHELQVTPGGSSILAITVCPFAVSTGMFDGIYSTHDNLLRRVLLPLLTARDVSRATLQAIATATEFVVVPWYFEWLIPVFRLLPLPVYDALAATAGARHGMHGFTGRRSSQHNEDRMATVDEKGGATMQSSSRKSRRRSVRGQHTS